MKTNTQFEQRGRGKYEEKALRIGVLLLLVILNSLIAFSFSPNNFKEIRDKALELNSPHEIQKWVDSNIEHKFHYYPRSIHKTWEERKGDCTDKAILKYIMLRNIGLESRLIHGHAGGIKHDDIERNKFIFDNNEIWYGIWQ